MTALTILNSVQVEQVEQVGVLMNALNKYESDINVYRLDQSRWSEFWSEFHFGYLKNPVGARGFEPLTSSL